MRFQHKNYLAAYTGLAFGAAGYLLGPTPLFNLVVSAVIGFIVVGSWACGLAECAFAENDETLFQVGAYPGLILYSGLFGLAVASEASGLAVVLAWVATMFFLMSALTIDKSR